jgi:hypothetical protein
VGADRTHRPIAMRARVIVERSLTRTRCQCPPNATHHGTNDGGTDGIVAPHVRSMHTTMRRDRGHRYHPPMPAPIMS